MRTPFTFATFALFAAAAAAPLGLACSSDASGAPGDDAAAPDVFATSCAALADAEHLQQETCRGLALSEERVAELRTRRIAACKARSGVAGAAVTPEAVKACAAAREAEGCEGQPDAPPKACELPPGTLEEGAACTLDHQCASATCKRPIVGEPGAASLARCGTCAARVPLGRPCLSSDLCAVGSVCSNGDCTEIVPAGEGGSCAVPATPCAPGLRCTADKTCVPYGADGAPCAAENDCLPSLTCYRGVCGLAMQEGEPCGDVGQCAAGLGCNPETRTCAPVVLAGTDEACDGLVILCAVGDCEVPRRQRMGTCVAPAADGAACVAGASSGGCDVGAFCTESVCELAGSATCR